MLANKKFLDIPVDGTIYVEPSGDDVLGDGSLSRPYATLQKAVTEAALLSPGYYTIQLAPGNYGGAPIAWPVVPGVNVSLVGSGSASGVSTPITYTSIADPFEESVLFQNLGLTELNIDLAAAGGVPKVAQVTVANAGVNINRIDTLPAGSQIVRLFNCLINGLDTSSAIFMSGCQYTGGSIVVQATGTLLVLSGSVAGCPAITVDGSMVLMGVLCAFASFGGTGTLVTDAASLAPAFAPAAVTTSSVVFADTAQYIGYTPSTPANWAVVPDDVKEALDALSGLAGKASTFEETSDDTNFNTTSATDVVITGMELTPPAGKYAIWFNANLAIGTNNVEGVASIYKDGVQIAFSERSALASGAGWMGNISGMAVEDFDGVQVCDIRIRSDGVNQVDVNERSFLMMRLSD